MNGARADAERARLAFRRLDERDLLNLAEGIATKHITTLDDVLSACRRREVVAARRELAATLRRMGLSYPTIGHIIGRDHTTVMMLVRKAEEAA